MKAVFIVPGPDGGHVEIRDAADPVAGAGQVLVRVRAAGLNRGELIVLANARQGEARINGIEFSGEVVATGTGVEEWAVGDRVMGHGAQAMAGLVSVDQRALFRVPDTMSFTDAAAIPNVFVTAHDAIVTHGRLAAGETVLVNAASSGIGTAAIQISRLLGAGKIIATSRTDAKRDRIEALGATQLIATEGQDWVAGALSATSEKGVDLVVDSLGGAVFADNMRAMALCGRLISVGRIAGKIAEIDLDHVSVRRLEIIGVTFRTRTPEETLACVEAARRDLQAPIDRGEIKPVVDSIFAMADIGAAHERLASNLQTGKIILEIDQD